MSEISVSAQEASGSPITLDEIRNKALRIRDEVKVKVTGRVEEKRNQLIAVGVITLVAVVGIAYLVGSRAGRRAAEPPVR